MTAERFRLNISFGLITLLVTVAILAPLSVGTNGVSLHNSEINSSQTEKLSVDGPRPVAKAIEALEAKYGVAISYEDPRYIHEGDIVDETDPKYRQANPNGFRALTPKGSRLEINYRVPSATQQPEDTGRVIQAVLDAHAATGGAGRFQLKRTGQLFHVVPSQVKDQAGKWVNQSSILDLPIIFPKQERTALKTVELMARLLSQAAKIPVTIGIAPWTPLIRQSVDLEGTNESARDVLMKVLNSVEGRFSWQLFYAPSMKSYFLNIHRVK